MVDRSVSIRLGLDPSAFNRGLLVAGTSAKAFVRDLDSADSRMANLVQTSLALGPALVPVAAAGAGAIAGLAESLGAAAGGIAVTALAFQGVGDALKALSQFNLDPTQANFEKLEETLRKLGPEGQEFVSFISKLQPKLQELRETAQAGVLPGVQEGIQNLLPLLPQIEGVISSLGSAVGQMASEGGAALNSPFWRDFLQFIETDGRESLITMGEIVGQLTKAAAGLVMAFHPLSEDIGNALLDQATALADASANLGETQGFQNFVEFVERVGPKVWETLGALAEALIAVSKAAAPVGEATLPIITALAKVITLIAESPIGPVLIATAAGLSAISRAVALFNLTSGSALGNLLFGGKDTTPTMERNIRMIRATGAALGVLALSMTDLDEKAGLSNTLNLGLLGAATGNPFIAAGAATFGFIQDRRTAENADMDAFFAKVNGAIEEERLAALDRTTNSQQAAFDFRQGAPMLFSDTTEGRTDALIDAFAGLDDQIQSTASSADALQTALDDLLNPNLNVEAATDALTTALRHLNEDLAKNNKTLEGNNDAAITNRAALRSRVSAVVDQINAEAHAGATSRELAKSFETQRDRLLKAADAAGLNVKQVKELIRTYGLTPKLVETIIRANTNPAREAARRLIQEINGSTAYITVKSINATAANQQAAAAARGQADGSVLRFFGMGGVERHVAQVAPAGAMRVWAEPETGGEAYIPLALSKRPRSEAILSEVARQFGGQFVRFASGGFHTSPVVNVQGGSVSLSGMRVQIDTGRGTFWGTVRDVARHEVDAQASYAGTSGRQG